MNPKLAVALVVVALSSILLIKVVGGGMLTAQGQLERGHELVQEGDAEGALEMFNSASKRFEPGSDEWYEAAKGRTLALVGIDPPRSSMEFLVLADAAPAHFDEQDYKLLIGRLNDERAYFIALTIIDSGLTRWPENETLLIYLTKLRAKAEELGNENLVDAIASMPYAFSGDE